MSDIYKNMAANALRMIADKGRALLITMPGTEHEYDPLSDTFTEGEDETATVKGVFTKFATKEIDGELILRTDKKVLIAAASLTQVPDNTATITDGGVIYNIINTEIVQPGDTPLLYLVQARR